jgi:hypothetical protein
MDKGDWTITTALGMVTGVLGFLAKALRTPRPTSLENGRRQAELDLIRSVSAGIRSDLDILRDIGFKEHGSRLYELEALSRKIKERQDEMIQKQAEMNDAITEILRQLRGRRHRSFDQPSS